MPLLSHKLSEGRACVVCLCNSNAQPSSYPPQQICFGGIKRKEAWKETSTMIGSASFVQIRLHLAKTRGNSIGKTSLRVSRLGEDCLLWNKVLLRALTASHRCPTQTSLGKQKILLVHGLSPQQDQGWLTPGTQSSAAQSSFCDLTPVFQLYSPSPGSPFIEGIGQW